MNLLDIDHDALAREAELAVGMASAGAPSAGPCPQVVQAPPAETWAPIVAGMMGLADVVAPNWNLEAAEKDAFADALTPVLDQLFPGGLGDERWAPYVRLLAVSAGIVMVRVENGRLRPLRAPVRPANDDPPDGAAGGT